MWECTPLSEETDEVNMASRLLGVFHACDDGAILVELALSDGHIDGDDALLHHKQSRQG